MSSTATTVTYGSIPVDGLNIAYREAGNPANPKLVLLHGFPASSHQYRDLIRALGGTFHVIAPDYPGFGLSDIPDPATFPTRSTTSRTSPRPSWPRSGSRASASTCRTTAGRSGSASLVDDQSGWNG